MTKRGTFAILFGFAATLGGCFDDPAGETSGSTSSSETSTSDSPTGTETGVETETGDDPCMSEGCACEDDDDCEGALQCLEGMCASPFCGDSVVDPDEECDDGNAIGGDGCDNDCSYTELLAVDSGGGHTCVLIEGGRVRCWGLSNAGQLGVGTTETLGDDELPNSIEDVPLPGPAVQISAGLHIHTCALLEDETVYCWGGNAFGQLGYGNTENLGDDDFPQGPVDVGAPVKQVMGGVGHTCARTISDTVRCWGANVFGQLGYGNTMNIGANSVPSSAGDLGLGGMYAQVSAGTAHACAIGVTGPVLCWGNNEDGQLGYGNTENIGDDELPGSVGPAPIVPLGLAPTTKAVAITTGVAHSCALFETGDALCWGFNDAGQLGTGGTTTLGDDEEPGTFPALDLPELAEIRAGSAHTCALTVDNELYCWGNNAFGQLGYGDVEYIGDDDLPMSAGPVDLGAPVRAIGPGFFHTCAITETNELRCWGNNDTGQLGLGHTNKVGDDEFPLDVDPVQIF